MIYLIRLTAPHFVAGFEATDMFVKRAAPIIHYMVGWDYYQVIRYCEKKKWKWERVNVDN